MVKENGMLLCSLLKINWVICPHKSLDRLITVLFL